MSEEHSLVTLSNNDFLAMKHYAEGQFLELTHQLGQIAAIAQEQDDRSLLPEIKHALTVANDIANQLETDFEGAIAKMAGLAELAREFREQRNAEIMRNETVRDEGREEGFSDGVMHAFEVEDAMDEAAVEWYFSLMCEYDSAEEVMAEESEKLQRRLNKAKEEYEWWLANDKPSQDDAA